MQELYGQCHGAMLLLHGGAGARDPGQGQLQQATADLDDIAAQGLKNLAGGLSPLDVVVACLQAMELNERFNAGRGSALQADRQARLTAALMSGPEEKFTSVISASYIVHPSLIARHLQSWDGDARVLTNPGAELIARQLGLPLESSVTAKRMQEWTDRALVKDWTQPGPSSACDTVGCLLRTATGELFAGTSTGGRGFEFPGRVSDAGTVAGTYASPEAAISATGIGEEIVDDALAARLESRCRDGMSLEAASRKCFVEANGKHRSYGWIAVDSGAYWAVAYTTMAMSFVVRSAERGRVAAAFAL